MFTIIGEYRKKKRSYPFKKRVQARDKDEALNKLFSIIGSNHKVKRHLIKILEVKNEE